MRAIRRLLCISFVLASFVAPLHAAVVGTVINIDGKPVSGAKVSLYAQELIAAQGQRFLSAESQRKALLTATTALGSARAQQAQARWVWAFALAQLSHDVGALGPRGESLIPLAADSTRIRR